MFYAIFPKFEPECFFALMREEKKFFLRRGRRDSEDRTD